MVVLLSAPPAAAQAGADCAAQIAAQRLAWGVTGAPRVQPPGAAGAAILHWPTAIMGTWIVEVRVPRDTSLRRVADGRLTEVVWSADCTPSSTDVSPPTRRPDHFTDADLRRLVAEHPHGLLYIWSPHMPLSVDGVTSARTLARRRRLPLTILLAPGANVALARRVAAKQGWPSDAFLVADATELAFRDVLVHAPTLQPYAGGRLVGNALPGYHTNDEYAAYLDRVFTAEP